MIVHFDFNIEEKITTTSGRTGYICAAMIDAGGKRYEVILWGDCGRQIEWLYEWEIAPSTATKEG